MRELTLRGLILGALITVVFTAANVYLGLKVGLTFASSIPAAVISMAVLRALGGGNILENNMVQTQASAAGTLSSVIFVLPGLVMVGHWHGFPFWQAAGVCAAGGVMGVLFTIPLRRAMVVNSTLPYPEGVAAAEILRVGHGQAEPGEPGALDIAAGGIVAAVVSFAATGLHVLGEGISRWFTIGNAAFRLSTGFSLALLGAGYLVGIAGGLSMLLGAVLAWGVAVPVLTALHPVPAGTAMIPYATGLWAHQVRFMGAGTIAVAAIWSLAGLLGPTIQGVRDSLRASRLGAGEAGAPQTDLDLSPRWIGIVFAVALAAMAVTFAAFLAGTGSATHIWELVAFACLFSVLFGFAVAAACGYMAGLVGSSSSPISGIAIIATILTSLLLLLILGGTGALANEDGRQAAIAFTLFIVSVVLATATVSNDNLQDLKTGYLVGATPWRQQVVLVVGCVVGALVIPPVLDLLYHAYGFPGAMPDPRMDPNQALAAPQATLMAAIARGIFGHALDWTSVGIGVAGGVILIVVDFMLKRASRGGLPVLAVGIGLYLPPTVGVTLAAGAILGWIIDRRLAGRADGDRARRRGVLVASGFIVGESLVGVAMAGVIGASGSQAPLALAGDAFAGTAGWLGLAVFAAVAVWFAVFCAWPKKESSSFLKKRTKKLSSVGFATAWHKFFASFLQKRRLSPFMLNPVDFLFLRHGETDWNAQGLSQGRVDVPLNALGRAQAAEAGRKLQDQGVHRIVASSLGRARQTAEIVGDALGIAFTMDPDLREASFGDQEGKLMGDWYNAWVAGDYTPQGGEPFAALQERVVAAVNRASGGPGLVLIVAHGAMFRAVRAAMGLSALVRTENGAVLRCSPGAPWTIIPVA